MRTHEHAKNTDSLGRYYTSATISRFLIDQLPCRRPAAVLDLGVGQGALSLAASARWSDSDLITVDVDGQASTELPLKLQRAGFRGEHAHYREDALASHLPTLLPSSRGRLPDVGICNPPFVIQKWRRTTYGAILEEAGFSGCLPTIAATDAAVLFLAQNLRMVAAGGYVGIIVPDSLVSADKYVRFRTALLSRYNVLQAIRLPRGSFGGTDALAHILIIGKDRPLGETVKLCSLTDDCRLSPIIRVNIDQAARRLEYAYHSAHSTVTASSPRLGSICTDLRRGSLNSAQARQCGSFVLHTTHLTEDTCGSWIDFSSNDYRPTTSIGSALVAHAGDIVVARVGRTSAHKVIGIAKGSVALTDCLYRLQVPPQYRNAVLSTLSSAAGRDWLELHAYGVAAQQLTKSDLLNLPLALT